MSEMMIIARFQALLLAALALAGSLWADPAAADEARARGPDRGDLAGFVVTPQDEAGGNRAFLIAPNSAWFLATSPTASVARLIDINTGRTLRLLSSPGLHIAALSISPDSKTVFARDVDGGFVVWDAATGNAVPADKEPDFHDIKSLTSYYDATEPSIRPPAEFLSRHHLELRFPDLKKFDEITVNPTQAYAIVGIVGEPEWKTFKIWNLKEEKTEVFFRFESDSCGGHPFAFDYEGKYLVFGNSGGGCDSSHLDFTVFKIDEVGPGTGPRELRATQVLGGTCKSPVDPGFKQEFAVSSGGHLITRGGGMPGSPAWAAWDLRTGKEVASIRPDGIGLISDDEKTIAVLQAARGDEARPMMTVRRSGKQRTFAIARVAEADGRRSEAISPNGRWIASLAGQTVVVWSSDDGKALREYNIGADRNVDTMRVTNTGDPLLIDDREGAVFAKGAWRAVRSRPEALVVPLTPNFHAQCGVMFCDRVIDEFGVVERTAVDQRAREARSKDLSADGRWLAVLSRPTTGGLSRGTDIVDIVSGRILMHLDQERPQFTPDGRFIVARDHDLDGFIKYDLVTRERIWTTIPNGRQDGFHMMLANGRVRYSAGGDRDLLLVRGFDARPLDHDNAKQFLALPDTNDSQ